MDHLTMLLLVKEQKSRWRVVLTPHLDLSSAEAKMGREEGREKRPDSVKSPAGMLKALHDGKAERQIWMSSRAS
jgi:hypothetical protein